MATYIALFNFTEKGAKTAKQTVKRAENNRKLAKKAGVTMKDTHWTLGAYDGITVLEAPDDETITAFMLSVAEAGFVKTHTMRAFPEAEMKKIVGKKP